MYKSDVEGKKKARETNIEVEGQGEGILDEGEGERRVKFYVRITGK